MLIFCLYDIATRPEGNPVPRRGLRIWFFYPRAILSRAWIYKHSPPAGGRFRAHTSVYKHDSFAGGDWSRVSMCILIHTPAFPILFRTEGQKIG